jgi:hypothetical protein
MQSLRQVQWPLRCRRCGSDFGALFQMMGVPFGATVRSRMSRSKLFW